MIRSRFSFLTVYMPCLLMGALFCYGISFLLHPEVQFHNKFGGTNSALIPGVFLTGFMLVVLFFFLKYIFFIRIGPDEIRVRNLYSNRRLSPDQIRSIDLLSRDLLLSGGPYETVGIELRDGKRIILADSFYRNMPAMKRAIRDTYRDIVVPLPVRKKKVKDAGVSDYDPEFGPPMDRFSGNYFTSFNGIMFYGTALFIFLMGLNILRSSNSPDSLIPLLAIIGLFYFLFGIQLYYFNISDECLEVRNHLFPWYAKRYPIDSIIGVVLESPYRRSNSLRIRTDDLASRTYGAGSLRVNDWEALRARLHGLDISIIKEF